MWQAVWEAAVVSWSGQREAGLAGWGEAACWGEQLGEGPGWALLSALLGDPAQSTNGVRMKGSGLGGIECVEGQ